MVTCSVCGKEFKSRAGLAGHQQFKHAPLAATGASYEQQGRVSIAASLAAGEAAGDQVGEVLEAAFSEQLERLETMLGGERHRRDREVAQLAFDKGYERGKADMLEIPGVELAKDYNDRAKARNEQCPSKPIVDSFGDIPGVREAMDKYWVGNKMITLIR